MKPNKGFITVLMMVLISISLSTFSRAAFDTFSDVPNDSPFHESIFYLAERGIVCGEGNGRYVPDEPVTVRQWATMLCRALGDADPLNYDDDCIRQGYSDGWLEMTAITAPDSDLCRYAIYKSGFAAFGVDLYSLQLYPNEGKLSQQSEVLRAAADFGLCEDTCDGTEIITRGEAAELLYALLTSGQQSGRRFEQLLVGDSKNSRINDAVICRKGLAVCYRFRLPCKAEQRI